MINLSIMICSVNDRVSDFLPRLITELKRQTMNTPNVEVITFIDNKRRTVGDKRNDLLNLSNGRYVVFVDDDDMVEPDYVAQLLEGIKQGTDVICFGAKRYVNGVFDKEVKYGIQYRQDKDTNEMYFRIPNHLMCFKRDVAISVPYPSISFGEDAKWAMAVKYRIQSQHTIDKVLYHYYFSPETTQTQK